MAPLSDAIRTALSYVRHDETHVYKGAVDPDWTIGAVPHGGYMASMLTHAALLHTSSTPHPDPAHMTAQFLVASSVAPTEIHITTFTTSKRWTRLDVSLFQPSPDGSGEKLLRIRAHFLFTKLAPLQPPTLPSQHSMTVLPHTPTEYARICPIPTHPAKTVVSKMHKAFNFRHHVQWAEDAGVTPRDDHEGRKKLEWGAWFELVSPAEDIRLSSAVIPFYADMFRNGPELIPYTRPVGAAYVGAWYPTLTFSLDFKSPFPLSPIPSLDSPVAPRTVGLYSVSNTIRDGRHDNTVEVWSAPCGIAEEGIEVGSEEWRKRCQILAVSTQMALVVPMALNLEKGKAKL